MLFFFTALALEDVFKIENALEKTANMI